MGGPLGAYEEELHPFLAKECELLRAAADRGTPVLGVCLGARWQKRSEPGSFLDTEQRLGSEKWY